MVYYAVHSKMYNSGKIEAFMDAHEYDKKPCTIRETKENYRCFTDFFLREQDAKAQLDALFQCL